MSTTTSVTASATSLAQQLLDLKNSSTLSLMDCLKSSGDSLTATVLNAASDTCSLSAISQSLSSIAKAARNSEVTDTEVMNNVQLFAMDLQSDGYDIVSIMKYLSMIRKLAEDDPERFTELFSGSEDSDASSTLDSLITTDSEGDSEE